MTVSSTRRWSGFAMFALNQGEVCTCPSRALIQESIYERLSSAIKRVAAITRRPLIRNDDRCPGIERAVGEDPVLSRHRPAGRRAMPDRRSAYPSRGRPQGRLLRSADGVQGSTDAHFPGRNLRPWVLSVTTFKNEDEALAIANDTLYSVQGLEPRHEYRVPHGSWNPGWRVGRTAITIFGARGARWLQESGIGRENHKMMLDHYQQTKNVGEL